MPGTRLKAVLWDMDGVIADTADYHYEAWKETFQKRGIKFSREDFRRNFGQRNDTIIRRFVGDSIAQAELDSIAAEKELSYRQKVMRNIRPLPGAIELMKSLRERGIKMAIASSAPMENIQLIIRGLGIESYFQAIVWGREVTEGKPSPQVFLLAARKLGFEPANCVVLEDAVAGVAAARSAGMKCVAITNTHPAASLKEADLIVDSLTEVDISDLEALFDRREHVSQQLPGG